MPDRLVVQPQQVLGQLLAGVLLVDVDDGLLGDPVDPAGTGDHRHAGQLTGVELDQMGRHLDHDTLNAPLEQAWPRRRRHSRADRSGTDTNAIV